MENQSVIKEDLQTVQQILGALQSPVVTIVGVHYGSSTKKYYYKTTEPKIDVGSHVIVDSPHSGVVSLEVVESGTAKELGFNNQQVGSIKWIVQKVDFYSYVVQREAEERVKNDLLKSMEAKRAQDVLEYARSTFGAGVDSMFSAYSSQLACLPSPTPSPTAS